jgi:hypothetical protein
LEKSVVSPPQAGCSNQEEERVNKEKKQRLIRRYLERVSPDHSLESLGAGPSLSAMLGSVGDEEAELATRAFELARRFGECGDWFDLRDRRRSITR